MKKYQATSDLTALSNHQSYARNVDHVDTVQITDVCSAERQVETQGIFIPNNQR